jgi:hypothetical protein
VIGVIRVPTQRDPNGFRPLVVIRRRRAVRAVGTVPLQEPLPPGRAPRPSRVATQSDWPQAPGARLLTVAEAAHIAGVSPEAIQRAWRDGSLCRSRDVADGKDKVKLSRLVVRFHLNPRLLLPT